jgi:hypothetical protein
MAGIVAGHGEARGLLAAGRAGALPGHGVVVKYGGEFSTL